MPLGLTHGGCKMKLRWLTVVALLVGACTPTAVAPSVPAPSVAPSSVTTPSAVAPDPAVSATPAAPGVTAPASTDATSDEGTPLPPDPSADHTVGETIILSDFYDEEQAAFTVLEAIQRTQSDASSGPEYAFLVEIEGLTSSLHYNVLQFSMFDDESFEYQPQYGLQQPELEFGDLIKGRKVRGWLTFVGPDASAYLELQWVSITSEEPVFVRVLLP